MPIQVQAVWPCEVQDASKYTFMAFDKSNQKDISECLKQCEKSIGCLALTYYEYGGECFLFREIVAATQEENAKSIKIDCDKEIKEDTQIGISGQGEKNSMIVVIISVSCNVILVTLLLIIAGCLMARKKRKQKEPKEIIDINPEYGNKLYDGEDYEESALTDANPDYVDSVWYYKHQPSIASQN